MTAIFELRGCDVHFSFGSEDRPFLPSTALNVYTSPEQFSATRAGSFKLSSTHARAAMITVVWVAECIMSQGLAFTFSPPMAVIGVVGGLPKSQTDSSILFFNFRAGGAYGLDRALATEEKPNCTYRLPLG